MRRTRFSIPKETELTIKRSQDYKTCIIAKLEDDTFCIIFPTGAKIIKSSLSEAKELVDELSEEPDQIVEEYPRAGYAVNPPKSCPKRVKFEDGGNWWVECCICSFYCVDTECRTYQEIMERRERNIKRTKYTTMAIKCPYCESELSDRGLDQWTYSCGTVADKPTNSYIRKCGLEKKSNPRRRR